MLELIIKINAMVLLSSIGCRPRTTSTYLCIERVECHCHRVAVYLPLQIRIGNEVFTPMDSNKLSKNYQLQ